MSNILNNVLLEVRVEEDKSAKSNKNYRVVRLYDPETGERVAQSFDLLATIENLILRKRIAELEQGR